MCAPSCSSSSPFSFARYIALLSFLSHPDLISLIESDALPSNVTIFLPLRLALAPHDNSLFIAASHVCEDALNEFDLFHFPSELPLKSLSGSSLVVSPGIVPTVNGVAIVEGPILFDGGNIFLIERPLTPASSVSPHTQHDATDSVASAESIVDACVTTGGDGCGMTRLRLAQQTILAHGHPALAPAWRAVVSSRPIQAAPY